MRAVTDKAARGHVGLSPEQEQALIAEYAALTGRDVNDIQVKKVWIEGKVIKADGSVRDLGIVSSSEPAEVTWKGDKDG